MSTAYHKKVAKDRANDEGLVVNPPSLGNLPGEGEVTYASQVKDVLIPYTTREDSFHYYEERNYVNDVNREHTEVLQTYDREFKAKETYTYGNGRSSYLNNETGDHYQYLTDQAGSVTSLTQDGNSVASLSYNLYGSTKASTDTTGNPFAYNGEARDITGLDYLRARYYDSSAGTFLTEDSYPGTPEEPLSQNGYTYVENDPVNHTDPSGHKKNWIQRAWKAIKKGADDIWGKTKKTVSDALSQGKQVMSDMWSTITKRAHDVWNDIPKLMGQGIDWIVGKVNPILQAIGQMAQSTIDWVGNNLMTAYHNIVNVWEKAKQIFKDPKILLQSKSKEASNLFKNLTISLAETIRHFCEVADRAVDETKGFIKKYFKNTPANEEQSLQDKLKSIHGNSKSSMSKTEDIIKAYEDYLYARNKAAFDRYWKIRKQYKNWNPASDIVAQEAEKQLGLALQSSGIDIKEILQSMGDDILKANPRMVDSPIVWDKSAGFVADNFHFVNLVNTNKPLDLKSRAYYSNSDSGYSIWSRDWGNGVKDDYAGNYLYGYVGKGFLQTSDDYLKYAAGVAQGISDGSYQKWQQQIDNGSYGDNSGDSAMIQDGIDAYKYRHR